MKRLLAVIAVLVAALLVVIPAFALSSISGAVYSGSITIDNAGTLATNVSTIMPLSTSGLMTSGFLNATATDAAIRINSTTDAAFMPAPGDTTNWCIFVPTATTAQQIYTLYTAGTVSGGKVRYFPGATGMTNSVNFPNLGTTYEIEIAGYLDLTGGGYYVQYDMAVGPQHFWLYNAAGQVTVNINDSVNTDSVTTAGLTSGEHTLKVTSDATNVKIYWDGVLANGTGIAGKADILRTATLSVVANSTKDMVDAASVPYMSTFKVWISGVLRQNIAWNYDAAAPYEFTDLSGNNNHTIPTFRTTSSDADVSGTLATFTPVSEAKASGSGITEGTMISGLPAEPGGDIYVEGDTQGIPVAPLIDPALGVALIPIEAFWYPVAFGLAIAGGFWAYKKTEELLAQCALSGLIMAAFVGGGVLGDGLLPWWTVIVFVLEALMIVVIKHREVVR